MKKINIILGMLIMLLVVVTAKAAWGAELEIKDVQVNGITIVANSAEINRLDNLILKFNINNVDLVNSVKADYKVYLGTEEKASSAKVLDLAKNSINTQTVTINNLISGVYTVKISVTNFITSAVTSYSFTLTVKEPAKVVITDSYFDTVSASCKGETRTLTLKYANVGTTDEKVDLSVKSETPFKTVTENQIVLNQNDKKTSTVAVDTSLLPAGTYHFVAELTYANGIKTSSPIISLTKTSCLSSVSPTVTAISMTDKESKDFKVTSLEDVTITWYLNNVQVKSNNLVKESAYTLTNNVPGDYVLKATVGQDSTTWNIKVSAYVATVASLQVSDININPANRGNTYNATFTITNPGTEKGITNLKSVLTGFNTEYKVSISTLPETLGPKESVTGTLSIYLPTDENAGNHQIGTISLTSDQANASVKVFVNPNTYLTIDTVEINGDEDGDLTPETENKVEITIKNDYTEDMTDIVVTATLIDVDGDDLEEESESFDLDVGDDDTASVTFNLATENLDEDSYTLEITVEGEADDNSNHKTVETRTISVDRETHQVIIAEATLTPESIECLESATVNVNVKNIGKSNEDDIQIKVQNSALNLNEIKKLELDKFSGNDNTDSISFNIDTEKAVLGKYSINVELYRDGKKEDSTILSLDVKGCSNTQTQTQNTYNSEEITKQLQQQLAAQLEAKKVAEQKAKITTTSNFHESETYMIMLGALVLMVIIAVIMGISIIARKKH